MRIAGLRAGLAWAHDWLSNASVTAVFAAAPGAPAVLAGAAQPNDWALTSLGGRTRADLALVGRGKIRRPVCGLRANLHRHAALQLVAAFGFIECPLRQSRHTGAITPA
jgi:hypothetical protein